MKPTTTAQTTSINILDSLKTAALQTARLGDKKPAHRLAPAKRKTSSTTGPVHRIIQGECLAMMAKIPDRSIDFICADFPYNISGKGGVTMRGDRVVAADFGEWDKFPSDEDYLDFVFAVCAAYRRILKPNASMVLFF
jgi:modification methylase